MQVRGETHGGTGMAAEDREILTTLWEGKIPVQIELAAEDNISFGRTDPLFLLIPRVSYLPLFADRIRKHFEKCLTSSVEEAGNASSSRSEDLWLESNTFRVPLKWHVPVGVLFDLFGQEKVPWELTARFSNFPSNVVMRFPSKEAVESVFLYTVKEAAAIKQMTAVMSKMQRQEHSQLWLGLINDRFDQFWSVNRQLMRRSEEDSAKPVPIRAHDTNGRTFQKLIPGHVTFGDALEALGIRDRDVIVQGIQVSYEIPLSWMGCNLSYPDNFIHVSIRN
ncbi:unnamed protein product [Cyprideis torosa]|uniref:Autophagy protein 5 n=1 Tax=Cyprideis torosa TaxID=163714 RepID=A0A7R8ZIC3_9CRUS|nr:unnamed protein product [Cyprideis torosa]CAG0885780.1 unnamed protein product [Cyprideis torosa]